MGSGQACVAGDGVGVDADQAGGFAGADPLGDVGQHGLGGVVGKARVEEGCQGEEVMTELAISKQLAALPDWKAEHNQAMRCLDLEGGAALVITCVQMLEKTDAQFSLQMFRKEITLEPGERHFEWIKKANLEAIAYIADLVPELRKFAQSYEVKGLDELVALEKKLRGILTPDEDFFGDELDELAIAAAVEHKAGRAEEYA